MEPRFLSLRSIYKLPIHLKAGKINIRKEFSHTPYLYDYSGEITVKLFAKKEISDELLAQNLLEDLITQTFGSEWVYEEFL